MFYGFYIKLLSFRQEFRVILMKISFGLQVICLTFMSDFNRTETVWTDFNKSPQYKSSLNSFQWQPRFCVQAEVKKEGRAGITKLRVPFCNFVVLHKKYT